MDSINLFNTSNRSIFFPKKYEPTWLTPDGTEIGGLAVSKDRCERTGLDAGTRGRHYSRIVRTQR